LDDFQDHHMVKPKLVYISNASEIGSIYSKNELRTLYEFCQLNHLFLFMDGARLGSALSSSDNNLTFQDLAIFTDIFYIGGTKNGALIGEAIVINNRVLQKDFEFHLKQRGALLSKGRIFGIQFTTLFKDDLFFKLAQHANRLALKIAIAFEEKGYAFLTKPVTNQIFPIVPEALIQKLLIDYDFYIWEKIDDEKSAIRIVTSWATDEKMVDAFIKEINLF